MPRTKKEQTIYCIEHDFSLKPLRSDTHYKQNIYASFCSGKAIQVQKSRSKKLKIKEQTVNQSCLKCPIFNRDKNPGTNAFILIDEQKDYMDSFDQLLRDHNKKVNNFKFTLDEKSQLMIPKPKTKYSYCNVCRCNYQEYLIHIKSTPHKNNIQKSVFSKYIRQFEQKYREERKKIKTQRKPYCYSGQPTQPSVDDDDDVVEIKYYQPRKMVKRQVQVDQKYNEVYPYQFTQNPQNQPNMAPMYPVNSFTQNFFFNLPVALPMSPIVPMSSIDNIEFLSRNLINHQITNNLLNKYIDTVKKNNASLNQTNAQFYINQPNQLYFQQNPQTQTRKIQKNYQNWHQNQQGPEVIDLLSDQDQK